MPPPGGRLGGSIRAGSAAAIQFTTSWELICGPCSGRLQSPHVSGSPRTGPTVTHTTTLPSVDELFLKWKQLLEDGSLATAASVAGDRAELVDPLQHLINAFIAERSAGVDRTLSLGEGTQTEFELPPELPGFTILSTLGGGGMGVVYRVRDRLDREFALKRARSSQLSPAGRERFLDEARAMSQLDHPHVVPIHHLDEHGGDPYFLMPIYPASLASRLADYADDPVKSMRLMTGVANGLGHLHSKGYIHRDLKPQNILIAVDGRPAVSDFGLVKNLSEIADEPAPEPGSAVASGETRPTGAKKSRTVVGVVIGTRAYMAPEQAAGLVHLVNPRWDVWSFGIVLHELLTGRRPPSSENPARLLNPATPDDPPPSTYKPGLDPKLERIICKCLARDERNRYADARSVARELDAWVQSKAGRPSRTFAVAALLLVLATAAIAISLFRKKPDTPPDPKAELLAQLARHDPVELIGATGKPAYFRVLAARPGTNPIDDSAEFTVNTQEPILVELVPAEANLSGFHLSGEVQFIAHTDWTARAGFYVNHHLDGPDHVFLNWTFAEWSGPSVLLKPNELKPNQMQGNFALSISHLVDADSGRQTLSPIPTTYEPFTYDLPGRDNPWPSRLLGLRVSGQVVEPEWQNAQAGSQQTARLDKLWNMAYPNHPRPAAGPAGGIGLYISPGAAIFRNVTLTPNP
jgi:serine/threonine protein kinase